MSTPVYITGSGLISAQGVGVTQNWKNLLAGRVLHETGIVSIERDHALPRVSQLAIRAAGEALNSAGLPNLADARTALVVGTSKGPIEDWIDQLNGRRPANICLGVGQVAADVALKFGHAGGARLTYAAACASGLHALIQAFDLIRTGQQDRALVVAAEASTHALFSANFSRLGVLANNADGCRPFDQHRRGFLLGEAAAAVWLTNQPTPDAVQIEAAAALGDATHLTGTDSAGHAQHQLIASLTGPHIELVHAHGTGTVMNDAAELAAIASVLGQHEPAIYSHKHAIGHTQGAAGLIGVVLNLEMHRRRQILGNANTAKPMAVEGEGVVFISQSPVAYDFERSLVLASGFGGTLAGVRLFGGGQHGGYQP